MADAYKQTSNRSDAINIAMQKLDLPDNEITQDMLYTMWKAIDAYADLYDSL